MGVAVAIVVVDFDESPLLKWLLIRLSFSIFFVVSLIMFALIVHSLSLYQGLILTFLLVATNLQFLLTVNMNCFCIILIVHVMI